MSVAVVKVVSKDHPVVNAILGGPRRGQVEQRGHAGERLELFAVGAAGGAVEARVGNDQSAAARSSPRHGNMYVRSVDGEHGLSCVLGDVLEGGVQELVLPAVHERLAVVEKGEVSGDVSGAVTLVITETLTRDVGSPGRDPCTA